MNNIYFLIVLLLILFISIIIKFLKNNPPNPNPPNPNPPNPNPQPKSGKVVNFTSSGDLSEVDYMYVESYDSSGLVYSNDIYPLPPTGISKIGVLQGGYIIIYIITNSSKSLSKKIDDISLNNGQLLKVTYQNNNIVIN